MIYKVPCSWGVYGNIEGEYICDSFIIDMDIVAENYPDEFPLEGDK